jgi:peptidoglycan/LPS O-acetylase OafA/YrhL
LFASVTVFWARVTPNMVVIYGTDVRQVFIDGTFFWAGAVLYHWNIKKYFSFETFVIGLLLLIFIHQWGYLYSIVSLALIPFLVMTFGFSKAHYLAIFNKADYSYGFYIYAFPVQQTIIYLFPTISIFWYLVSGFIITMFFAVFSWHFVEKPMMRLKPKKVK